MGKNGAGGPLIQVEIDGDIAVITFNRPEKRNAVNDAFIGALEAFFAAPPEEVNAVILTGSGGHFCAGLDLAEHEERDPIEGVYHSRNWHRVLDLIEYGGSP
jgi:enoyl-CoA hydratase/carnithine racemase